VPVNGKKWDRRVARARELAEMYPFAKQVLLFYSRLTAFQSTLYFQLCSACASGNSGNRALPAVLDEVDLAHLLTCWRPFLLLIEAEAPSPLAAFARGLKASGPDAVAALLRASWPANLPAAIEADAGAQTAAGPRADLDPFEHFCAHAFLQPYAEFLADHAEVPAPPLRRPFCPYCGSSPVAGVLRPEGEGAKRSLVCSFCRTEWDYLRIACPACDERREEKLCVYTAPKFEAVRVEACGTCKAYILTVDLTKNGLAVPEVDTLAAIPLTLWANEKGHHKITRNILCL